MTGWNLPPGVTQRMIDDHFDEQPQPTAEEIAEENAFWDREQIRWTFQLPNTNSLRGASPILIECLLSIAEEFEAWEYFSGYST